MSGKRITEVVPDEHGGSSSLSLTFLGGPAVSVWTPSDTTMPGATEGELRMQLQPDQPVIIGRQDGGSLEYLDPAYSSTPMMPNAAGSILTRGEKDLYVSRGHFMLRSSPRGILLTNGVPRRGGGIRPPRNGTYLLAPVERWLENGEEFLIEK